MSVWETATGKWQRMKPLAIALGVGLLAGPLISNYLCRQRGDHRLRPQARELTC